jgi:hypothetical protein
MDFSKVCEGLELMRELERTIEHSDTEFEVLKHGKPYNCLQFLTVPFQMPSNGSKPCNCCINHLQNAKSVSKSQPNRLND